MARGSSCGDDSSDYGTDWTPKYLDHDMAGARGGHSCYRPRSLSGSSNQMPDGSTMSDERMREALFSPRDFCESRTSQQRGGK